MKGQYNVNSFWRAAEIAMSCTSPESNSRPTMSDVVLQLKECMSTEDSTGQSSDVDTNEMNRLPVYMCPMDSPSAR
ncbi:unnamed protein product [Spirodela intermedia]|uniref:Uncharacterized protein n=1 Tax=Spirodela intermedia TaxID=51605 RepID=A0A7I8JRK2_SPIIN|nr:unnamed protein product [Spirodela intermedia]CAA6672837.1 unnamed protein product [Spirodela intermedia]